MLTFICMVDYPLENQHIIVFQKLNPCYNGNACLCSLILHSERKKISGLGISSVIFDSSLTLLRHGDMTTTINTLLPAQIKLRILFDNNQYCNFLCFRYLVGCVIQLRAPEATRIN